MTANWSAGERNYKEMLRSAEWDVGNGTAPRIRYVILSLPRTGSELVCADLRKRGIGVPLEYFSIHGIAERLGSTNSEGHIFLPQYMAALYAKRTTPNGVFGAKMHPLHLKSMGGHDIAKAVQFLDLFDRIVVLRRRDKVLQAISLARAHMTGQFHILPGDAAKPVSGADDALFAQVGAFLGAILEDELYVSDVTARIEPRKLSAIWYEDLSDEAIASLASSLTPDSGAPAPSATLVAEHALPRRGDTREAQDIKRRFLSYVTGASASGLGPVASELA